MHDQKYASSHLRSSYVRSYIREALTPGFAVTVLLAVASTAFCALAQSAPYVARSASGPQLAAAAPAQPAPNEIDWP